MSVASVGVQGFGCCYLLIPHVVSLTSDAIFQSFCLVAFLKLVVFSIFELRIVLMIWKARRPALFNEGFVMMRHAKRRQNIFQVLLFGHTGGSARLPHVGFHCCASFVCLLVLDSANFCQCIF